MTNKELYSKAVKAYDNNVSIMSDEEFDNLEKLMEEGEVTFGGKGDVPHVVPMKSLSKGLTIDEALKFFENKKSFCLSSSPKLDGVSGDILIRNGKVVRCLTRGDGIYGVDITNVVISIIERSINIHQLSHTVEKDLHLSSFIIRGEFIIQKVFFEEINEVLALKEEPQISALRNAVGGFIKRKVMDESLLSFIDFIPYILLDDTGEFSYESFFSVLRHIFSPSLKNGLHPFYSSTWVKTFNDKNTLKDFLLDSIKKRDQFPYEIDGIVLRYDEVKAFKEEGETSHHPKGAIAWKFPATVKQVVIKDYIWSSGTKEISPVAIIDPIYLEGAVISKVSMHTLNNIIKCQAYIGNTVSLVRSGGVIPKISYSIENSSDIDEREIIKNVNIPKVCPSCGSSLTLNETYTKLMCDNGDCPSKLARKLEVFAKTIGIDEIGPETAEELVRIGILYPQNLWNITPNYLIENKSSLATEKTIENLVNQIFVTREVSEVQLLSSLSIFMVGSSVAEKLIVASKGLKNLLEMSLEEFTSVCPYNPDLSKKIYKSFTAVSSSIKCLMALLKVTPYKVILEGKFQSKVVVITGETHRSRSSLEALVKENGGKISSSVSSKTSFLVTNSSDLTSKMKKALELNIQIITEAELVELLK